MKILIVEDDITLAKELVRLCEKWGFDALYLECFQEVDKQFEQSGCDLVLMDINLPFLMGFTGAAKSADFPELPFCFYPAGIRMQIRLWQWYPGEMIM